MNCVYILRPGASHPASHLSMLILFSDPHFCPFPFFGYFSSAFHPSLVSWSLFFPTFMSFIICCKLSKTKHWDFWVTVWAAKLAQCVLLGGSGCPWLLCTAVSDPWNWNWCHLLGRNQCGRQGTDNLGARDSLLHSSMPCHVRGHRAYHPLHLPALLSPTRREKGWISCGYRIGKSPRVRFPSDSQPFHPCVTHLTALGRLPIYSAVRGESSPSGPIPGPATDFLCDLGQATLPPGAPFPQQ